MWLDIFVGSFTVKIIFSHPLTIGVYSQGKEVGPRQQILFSKNRRFRIGKHARSWKKVFLLQKWQKNL